jgi:demethylmenaquinone methyltransferase/2-methoxy-6-polyprenyl-1,4-benzoquinol methylase
MRLPGLENASVKAVDKNGDRVRDMFAQIAPRYDLMNHLLSLGIDISWRKQVVKKLDLSRDLPILDCCTGTGDLALMLAEKTAGRVEVIGTDFCAPMLELADRKHQQRLSNLPIRFMQADTQELPFDDASFQAVTVAFGLRNVQDTERGLREMLRVCAPGGQICVLEFSEPTLPGFRQVYRAYFNQILPRIGQRFASNNRDAYEYLPQSVSQFPCGQALKKKMEDVGVREVQVTTLTFGVASIYVGHRTK